MTIEIKVNGKEVFSTTATNVGVPKSNNFDPDCREYEVNNHTRIWHSRKDGILSLAKKVLMQYRDEDYKEGEQLDKLTKKEGITKLEIGG